jgi:hypothetical protein
VSLQKRRHPASHALTTDIIVLLIVGVILVAAFFFWERHVVNNTTRPPLMRLALWTRAHGRLAAVYMIGFVSWMGFVVSRRSNLV